MYMGQIIRPKLGVHYFQYARASIRPSVCQMNQPAKKIRNYMLDILLIDLSAMMHHLLLLWIIYVLFLCLVFLMLSRLSPAGKVLTSWLLLVMFIVFVLLSHVVSWVRCGI